jgi:HD-GYP domain-containing protein (c-di-GMP phosphodiesterase class II)
LNARIVKVADVWDAMTSDRPYRDALPRSKALKELTLHAGTQFDPGIVTLFIESVVKKNMA